MIDQSRANVADRPERIFLDRLSFRPAEMRHQNRLRALLSQIIDRRQTFADPGVIGDDDLAVAFFRRHVEINAHEHAFPAHVEIANG